MREKNFKMPIDLLKGHSYQLMECSECKFIFQKSAIFCVFSLLTNTRPYREIIG